MFFILLFYPTKFVKSSDQCFVYKKPAADCFVKINCPYISLLVFIKTIRLDGNRQVRNQQFFRSSFLNESYFSDFWLRRPKSLKSFHFSFLSQNELYILIALKDFTYIPRVATVISK